MSKTNVQASPMAPSNPRRAPHKFVCGLSKITGDDIHCIITICMDGVSVRFAGYPRWELAVFAAVLSTHFPTKSYYGPRRYSTKEIAEILSKVFRNFALVNEELGGK